MVHDFVEGFDTYTEKLGYTWDADVALADVDPSDYVALVIPGGRAPEYIRNDADAQRIIKAFFGDSRPVAHLCHGPLAVAAAGVLSGRRTAAYPALELDVLAAGAEYVDGGGVVDGNLVSGRAWPDHPEWMREFLRLLREHAPVESPELVAG